MRPNIIILLLDGESGVVAHALEAVCSVCPYLNDEDHKGEAVVAIGLLEFLRDPIITGPFEGLQLFNRVLIIKQLLGVVLYNKPFDLALIHKVILREKEIMHAILLL